MYGENSGTLRTELSKLLRQHRIQQRIGGAGTSSIPTTTTPAEREQTGRLIQSYRVGVLEWCQQALTSAEPTFYRSGRRLIPPEVSLRRRLKLTLKKATAPLPTLSDLTTPQKFPLVEAWRHAARAAALGEHDFTDDLQPGRLDITQRLTIVKDAAEILRGLVILDRRYDNVPGWLPLPHATTLRQAAEECAFITAEDYSIEHRGWRPHATRIDGPARPRIAGVVQAEHNLLVHLNQVPNAEGLRRLLESQRDLSQLLAIRIRNTEPEAAQRWMTRASTYAALQRETRNLGGTVGNAASAITEASHAITRLRRLPGDTAPDARARNDLQALFNAVDRRLADIVERGIRERLYFLSTPLPRLVENDGLLIHTVRTRYTPITPTLHPQLFDLVRHHLRPPSTPTEPNPGAAASRLELNEAIQHRPGHSDPSPTPHRPSI